MQTVNGRSVLTLSDMSTLCAAATKVERQSKGRLEFDQIGRVATGEDVDTVALRSEAEQLRALAPDVADLCDFIIEAVDLGPEPPLTGAALEEYIRAKIEDHLEDDDTDVELGTTFADLRAKGIIPRDMPESCGSPTC